MREGGSGIVDGISLMFERALKLEVDDDREVRIGPRPY